MGVDLFPASPAEPAEPLEVHCQHQRKASECQSLLCVCKHLFASQPTKYSRTRIKETRIKETFGYKKRFHCSAFMQDRPSTLIGQLITRRERLKSTLYLRLKKRKVFETVKGGPYGLFEKTVCCKISKN